MSVPTLSTDAAAAGPAPLARRILAQGRFEILAMIKNGEQLMLLVIFPILGLFALSRTSVLEATAQELGTDVVSAAVPGILALCVLSAALTGQGIATGFDRRYGVLRYLSTTPLGRGGLIAGKGLAVTAVVALQVLLIGTVGAILGWRPDPAGLLWAVPGILLGICAFTALGLLIAGTIRAEATLAVVNTLWVLLAGAGGMIFSVDSYPGPLRTLVELTPSAALGDALRAALIEQGPAWPQWAVLAAWAVLAGLCARRFFRWS